MIGGNLKAVLEKHQTRINEIGESVTCCTDKLELYGFLDLSSGNAQYTNYNAKIQESTHIFICDYKDLKGFTAENSSLVVNGEVYDVTLIDDPMFLHQHLEIYLQYRGMQNEK